MQIFLPSWISIKVEREAMSDGHFYAVCILIGFISALIAISFTMAVR